MIYDEVRDQLISQFAQIDTLNARAQQILGVGAGLLALVVSFRPPGESWSAGGLFTVALIPFALLVWYGHRAWEIKPWRRDPAPAPLWKKYKHRTPEHVRAQLIENLIESHKTNADAVKDKAGNLRRAQWSLVVEVACLVAVSVLIPHIR